MSIFNQKLINYAFYAALSSSGSIVVGLSVGQSYTFAKKWLLQYQMVTLTYLPIYLCDSTDSSDSLDSCDPCDSCDRSDSSDSSDSSYRSNCIDSSDKNKFCHIFFFFFSFFSFNFFSCDKTQKL